MHTCITLFGRRKTMDGNPLLLTVFTDQFRRENDDDYHQHVDPQSGQPVAFQATLHGKDVLDDYCIGFVSVAAICWFVREHRPCEIRIFGGQHEQVMVDAMCLAIDGGLSEHGAH